MPNENKLEDFVRFYALGKELDEASKGDTTKVNGRNRLKNAALAAVQNLDAYEALRTSFNDPQYGARAKLEMLDSQTNLDNLITSAKTGAQTEYLMAYANNQKMVDEISASKLEKVVLDIAPLPKEGDTEDIKKYNNIVAMHSTYLAMKNFAGMDDETFEKNYGNAKKAAMNAVLIQLEETVKANPALQNEKYVKSVKAFYDLALANPSLLKAHLNNYKKFGEKVEAAIGNKAEYARNNLNALLSNEKTYDAGLEAMYKAATVRED